MPANEQITVRLNIETMGDCFAFQFSSQSNSRAEQSIHVDGQLTLSTVNQFTIDPLPEIQNRCEWHKSTTELYERILAMGMPAGDSIRWTHQYWLGKNEILCQLIKPDSLQDDNRYALKVHPGIIDGCIQPNFMMLPPDIMDAFVAQQIHQFQFFGMQPGQLYLWGKLLPFSANDNSIVVDWYIVNAEGLIIAACHGCQLRKLFSAQNQNFVRINSNKTIQDFLKEQVAQLLMLTEHEINSEQSLLAIGMDSLMALALIKSIETNYQVTYPLAEFLNDATINKIAAFIKKAF